MPTRVVVAMSGGVDSSVAAALLHEQGFDVIGVTMELWGKDVCVSRGSRVCCSVRDAMDARASAKLLGIRHEILEGSIVFRAKVIDYFVNSYRSGLTPNPCIACNDHIKFGSLIEYAKGIGAEFVATGHYARVLHDTKSGRFVLKKASVYNKDQSYVLFNLSQSQLAQVKFPIGDLAKETVREIARSLGFRCAEKPDSQDVCFVRDGDKNGFLHRELNIGISPGPIIDREGKLLGTHQGLLGYTIGQREGIGIAVGSPLYVVALDQANNRLIVGSREDLQRRDLAAEAVNWVSIAVPKEPIEASVKIRARAELADACVIPEDGGRARVEFYGPQSAIAPGQAVVFYDDDVVLGGGWISQITCRRVYK